jgi:hypothetical protein
MAKTSTVTIPQKLTNNGTPEAAQGVSMTQMLAEALAGMVKDGTLGALLGASAPASPVVAPPQVQQTATVAGPKTSKTSKKASTAPASAAVPAGKFGAKLRTAGEATAKPVDAEESEKFSARAYFSLNPQMDLVRLDDQTFIGRSTDPKFGKNPIAIVGIQHRTLMLSEAKCMVLFEMLKAVCSE